MNDPLLNYEKMTPYQKGNLGVQEAMREFEGQGGLIHSREVTVELNGMRNRFDFVGEFDGQLHLFEVKNGSYAGFTVNQNINLPQIIMNHPQFVPVGRNAINVPQFRPIIGRPYAGNYVVVIKHYF